jgi:hydroxymethylbilane synthase
MTRVLRVATRASELALRRARVVQAMLTAQGMQSELVTFRTEGDKRFEEPFHSASARALFTHEVNAAVRRKRADIAVHAFPDLPTEPAPDLTVAAVLPRDDPRDAVVLNRLLEGTPLSELPRGTRVGTSSVRIRSLLYAVYPDMEVDHLRGDLLTRLRKVDEGQVHATIVPAAALHRLDVSQRISAYLDAPQWLPAPAQGTVVIQAREDDEQTIRSLSPLNDARTATHTAAERAFFAALEGGLQSPVSALVDESGGTQVLLGILVDLEGRHLLRGEHPLDDDQPELTGVRLANDLRAKGASSILDVLRRAERIPTPQPD